MSEQKETDLVTDRASLFPQLDDQCYLDHAGATLPSSRQIDRHAELLKSQLLTNPHSAASDDFSSNTIQEARNSILKFFHTTSDEYTVIFTSGATDSIRRVGEWFDYGREGGRLCYLRDNHTSVLGVREYALQRGATVQCVTETDLQLDSAQIDSAQIDDDTDDRDNVKEGSCGLFILPAQSNFSGRKYNLDIVSQVKSCTLSFSRRCEEWYVMVDSASLISTSPLNLYQSEIDFVPVSFYKLFGYPTGLGALLVKNTALDKLKKKYFGGGSVDIAGVDEFFHHPRHDRSQWLEDGTLPYQQIAALQFGFEEIQVVGGMEVISLHTYTLAKLAHDTLQSLTHYNSSPAVKLYCDTEYRDIRLQGAILSFNLIRSNGEYIGYNEVQQMAKLYKIVFRTGCFCNIGACQKYLNISTQQLRDNHKLGHKCGDGVDLIDGQPTGAVRVSFGYMSTHDDVRSLVDFIKEAFIERHMPLPLNITNGAKKMTSVKILLSGIRLYPVKSCSAFSVSEWQLSPSGLLYDRMWSIVDSNHRCLTQKRCADLRLIKPYIDLSNQRLVLTAEGSDESVSISLKHGPDENYNEISTQFCTVKVCGKDTSTLDCGDEAADWVSTVLCRPGCRLVRQSSPLHKQKKEVTEKTSTDTSLETPAKHSLANDSQYLLISMDSVTSLRDYIQDDMNCDVDANEMVDRFRANFVISGADPDEENGWSSLAIGDKKQFKFKCQGECTRCSMISIDQYSGQTQKEPLRSLTLIKGAKASFGIHLSNINFVCGTVRVGDIILPMYSSS